MRHAERSRDQQTPCPARAMPPAFLRWQCEERQQMFADLRRGHSPRFLASHLPVLSTLAAPGSEFPVRSCTKGVGLLPRPEYLTEHVREIEDCLARYGDRNGPASLRRRIDTALSLYARPQRVDPGLLGGIEIFRGGAYRSLRRDPRATLLFTGQCPGYLSFQFNCRVELVGGTDPRFAFLRGMRFLFERESFHIQQPDYPLGYVFHIHEVRDKTPRQLCGGAVRSVAEQETDADHPPPCHCGTA